MSAITFSAPGKILLTGGYLVLDPAYSGLVLSLSARIYVKVGQSRSTQTSQIFVKSPQFLNATWSFSILDAVVKANDPETDNPFVREAIQTVLVYLDLATDATSLEITIYADNQYYSLPKTQKRFSQSDKTIAETPKTGLGSSAALVTALCASLYFYLSGRDMRQTISDSDTRTIHNLSQIAHCRAQGKVGSGFDVASAVYGSCLYSRFPPSIIDHLPVKLTTETLMSCVHSDWQMKTEKRQLRKGLKLMMGDVSQGSSTPGMVKKVLSCASALDIWPSLSISNELLSDCLTADEPYSDSEQSSIRSYTTSVRNLMKQMGVEAKVDIEPDSQTTVLNETMKIDGVVACGVPGAGGFDAIFAIVSGSEDRVRELWKKHDVNVLDVRDDGSGIKLEGDFQA